MRRFPGKLARRAIIGAGPVSNAPMRAMRCTVLWLCVAGQQRVVEAAAGARVPYSAQTHIAPRALADSFIHNDQLIAPACSSRKLLSAFPD